MIRSETRQDRACRGHGNTGVIIASSYWQACSSDTIVALFFISLSHLLPYPSLSNVTGEDTAKKLLTFIPSSFFAREIAYFLLVRMSVVDTPQYFMKKHPHPPEGCNQRAVITTDPDLSSFHAHLRHDTVLRGIYSPLFLFPSEGAAFTRKPYNV